MADDYRIQGQVGSTGRKPQSVYVASSVSETVTLYTPEADHVFVVRYVSLTNTNVSLNAAVQLLSGTTSLLNVLLRPFTAFPDNDLILGIGGAPVLIGDEPGDALILTTVISASMVQGTILVDQVPLRD